MSNKLKWQDKIKAWHTFLAVLFLCGGTLLAWANIPARIDTLETGQEEQDKAISELRNELNEYNRKLDIILCLAQYPEDEMRRLRCELRDEEKEENGR